MIVTKESLRAIRKSDVDKISQSILNGESNNIVECFAELTQCFISADEASLDDLTCVTAQLSMTGVWTPENVAKLIPLLPKDPNITRCLKDGGVKL